MTGEMIHVVVTEGNREEWELARRRLEADLDGE